MDEKKDESRFGLVKNDYRERVWRERGGQNRLATAIGWARGHQDWLLPQWRNVLFSDESRFELVSDDYRERVWRERGGQNRLAAAIASVQQCLVRGKITLYYTFSRSIKFLITFAIMIIDCFASELNT
nr:unnamed protein product [Callosobruchus chinensis]